MATQKLSDFLRAATVADGSQANPVSLLIGDTGPAVKAPVAQLGVVSCTPKDTSTAFTLAEIVSGTGFFYTQLPGNCVWRLPTMADLGYTYNANRRLIIPIYQEGIGTIFINQATYRGTGTQADMLVLLGLQPGDYFIRTDTTPVGQVSIFGGGTISNLASWTKTIDPTAPNCPTVAGIVKNDPSGHAAELLNQYQSTALMSCGPDAWVYIG